MTGDAIPLEYVCARWAYSELLSAQPYYRSELKPLREKLAQGVPFDELNSVERALLIRKWRQVRGDPAVIRRLRGVAAFQRSPWTREQLGAAYVMTYFAQQVSRNPLVDRVTFKRWIDAEPIGLPPRDTLDTRPRVPPRPSSTGRGQSAGGAAEFTCSTAIAARSGFGRRNHLTPRLRSMCR